MEPRPVDDGLGLYRTMHLIRGAERLIIERYAEDEMRTPMHMSMGQEAVATGLCAALGEDGRVFGTYRSHALFLAKTGDPHRFFGELHGRVTGPSRGKAGSMHLAAPDRGLMCSSAIVGASIASAVGTAFADMRLGSGRACAALFGDGALEEGEFWEGLNAACAMRIPVLLVCEDNGWAVQSSKAVRHGFDDIAAVVRQFRCLVSEERTDDVEAIRDVMAQSIADAAAFGRPAFVHVRTRRHLGHIGVAEDFDAGYRPRTEHDACLLRDPLPMQRRRILGRGVAEACVRSVEAATDVLLAAAIKAAREAAEPSPDEVMAGVFR